MTDPQSPLVLVVDDEPTIRDLFGMALERAGMRTLAVPDGAAALAALRVADVALVLLDVNMPGTSGSEVVRTMRLDPLTATIPVIIVTGAATDDALIRGLEAGADDFVSKSVPLQELVARVSARLRSHRAWLSVLADEHARRADVVAAISRMRPTADPEAIAMSALDEIGRATQPEAMAVPALSPDAGVAPLATFERRGGVRRGGPSLPPADAARLVARLGEGPSAIVPSSPDGPLGRASSSVAAPIHGGGRLVGAITIALPSTVDGAPMPAGAARLLAGALDYAGILSVVLGPALVGRATADHAHAVLATALEDHAFHAVYQPIVRLGTEIVLAYEALTRFADGVNPERRFAEASAAGLGDDYELAALVVALAGASRLPRAMPLFLNVSPSLIVSGDRLAQVLADAGRPIVLEVTERTPIEDYPAVRAALGRLPGDVSLAVDDAGAGFASLRHILELHPAYAKLDLSLVRAIEHDTVRQAMVAGLAYFARLTGCQLVAEGVESRAEASVLADLGIGLAQGYLFARPGPLAGDA